ncbi:hypothetical protein EYF80_026306 [Liparis tanakae]|uniref:Uncharacterized protein n=1 Tax=Liparis tanakae TaxID=230148 RepID=A0A4Z2HCI5_9TELE|nr:hypothetical protein EYF80_026306 [Liparis tanakae]
MLGFSRVPSRYTWWSDRALYTAARTWRAGERRRHTCWQMLAYRARTLAFSRMASSDGVVSVIFSTERHLAKSAPSFLYCAQRSESPSRPAHNAPSDTRHRAFTPTLSQCGILVSHGG